MIAEQNIRVVSLNEFVQNYKGKGEKLIAADMLRRTNDRFNGQWLMLHVPFEHPDQFLNDDVDRLVPTEYRYLAMAVLCRHPVAVQFGLWKVADVDVGQVTRVEKVCICFERHCTKSVEICFCLRFHDTPQLVGRLQLRLINIFRRTVGWLCVSHSLDDN